MVVEIIYLKLMIDVNSVDCDVYVVYLEEVIWDCYKYIVMYDVLEDILFWQLYEDKLQVVEEDFNNFQFDDYKFVGYEVGNFYFMDYYDVRVVSNISLNYIDFVFWDGILEQFCVFLEGRILFSIFLMDFGGWFYVKVLEFEWFIYVGECSFIFGMKKVLQFFRVVYFIVMDINEIEFEEIV